MAARPPVLLDVVAGVEALVGHGQVAAQQAARQGDQEKVFKGSDLPPRGCASTSPIRCCMWPPAAPEFRPFRPQWAVDVGGGQPTRHPPDRCSIDSEAVVELSGALRQRPLRKPTLPLRRPFFSGPGRGVESFAAAPSVLWLMRPDVHSQRRNAAAAHHRRGFTVWE